MTLRNPFSTPSDPKLTFRSAHLPRLSTSTVPLSDTEYWSVFYTVFDNAYDVANLLHAQDITKALLSHPENVVSLVRTLAREVERLMRSSGFPSAKKEDGSGVSAYTPTFLVKENSTAKKEDTTRRMLNCLRVLSRIIPFVIAHEDGLLEEEVFWRPEGEGQAGSSELASSTSGQFVIDDEADQGADNRPEVPPKQAATQASTQPTLAEKLLDLAADLLFVQGFTLPVDTQAGRKVNYTIWENGIGSSVSMPVSRECDCNRTEVLRFLLVLLCKTLYIPSNAYSGFNYGESSQLMNRWHAHLVQMPSEAKSRKRLLSLLCSLLNTSLKSGAYYASKAGGLVGSIGGVVGDSYEKLVSGGKRREDPARLALVKTSVQAVNVLLCIPTREALQQANDSRSPPMSPAVNGNASMASISMLSQGSALGSNRSGSKNGSNAFLHYLSKLHRPSDVSFIVEVRLAAQEP